MTKFIEPIRHRPSPGPYAHPRKIKGCNFKVGDIVTLTVWMLHSTGCVVLEVLPGCKYLVEEPSGHIIECEGSWLVREVLDD